jgi:RNA polymerase sigma factor (sigma-70 family)
MATGAQRYRPLFLHALARLARQGFVVQPADAEDLFQGFYVDCWSGLAERYDPGKGTVGNYLYQAFLRHARQRVLRSRRWEQRLRDLGAIAENLADRGAGSPLEQMVREEEAEEEARRLEEEARRLDAALAELADLPRKVLLEFFAAGPRSQRKLAARYGTTRYRLQELLINAFGQLVTRLARRRAWSAADEEVARLFWCEGCDPEEAAARSGYPVAELLERRDRLKRALAAELSRLPRPSPPPLPADEGPESVRP